MGRKYNTLQCLAEICLSIGQPSDLLYTSDTTNSVHRTLLQCRGLIQDYTACKTRDNQRKFHKNMILSLI